MEFLKSIGIDIPLLITQIIGFGILVPLLWKFMFKPIFGILDSRQAEIKATYDQLDADRDAMLKTRQEYELRLAGIEAEAREKIQAAVKEAQTLRDGLIADAQKQADTLLQRARNESERERQKAFLEMRQQIVTLAVSAAGKLVGETLDAPRHTKLVDDFIASAGSGSIVDSGRGVSSNGFAGGQGGATA